MKKHALNLCIIILFSLALSSACGRPSPGPSTPTVTPVASPLLEENVQVKAWVAFERPGLNQLQIVYGKLVRGSQGIAGAKMYIVVRYANFDRRWPEAGFETTEENGIASVSFSITDAGSESRVTIDVYLIYDERIFHSTTSFVPHC